MDAIKKLNIIDEYDEIDVIDNVGLSLQAALIVDEAIRKKNKELNAGIDDKTNTWELIIRYIGEISIVAQELLFEYVELLGGFYIIWINEKDIYSLLKYKGILYIDKTSILQLQEYDRRLCNNVCTLNNGQIKRNGKGVYIAVIDSGIDIYNKIFINNSKTKIYKIWDQDVDGIPPSGYRFGTLYNENEINEYIGKQNDASNEKINSFDPSGHGTAVAAIAISCAYESKLVIVKLSRKQEINTTASLMMAIDYCIRISIIENVPMAINLSYGNNYGDHAGNTVLEKYIDTVSEFAKCGIAVGSGNDANTSKHNIITVNPYATERTSIIVGENNYSFNIQIWRRNNPLIKFTLIMPNGNKIGPFTTLNKNENYYENDMVITVVANNPTPYNFRFGMFVSIVSAKEYLQEGVYEIIFENPTSVETIINMWLPVEGELSGNVQFETPNLDNTLTIPSTANNVITVGAYNYRTNTYATFSGRGYTLDNIVKPDIVAPGVDVLSVDQNGIYNYYTGTSFATPYVTGEIARLLEYGIVQGNDYFLYGERLKSVIINNAKPLYGIINYPDKKVGWGALCLN
ncbi:MAG: S8 family serine peptidase [Lachnospiraceae bacterium]|nr:S8 family serine peptidase [Lachnospiraceae bacterium]